MRTITVENGALKIAFKRGAGFAEVLAAVKTLPGRRFDAESSAWFVPLTAASAMRIMEFAFENEFTVEEELAEKLGELAKDAPNDPKAIAANGKPVIAPHRDGLIAYFNYDEYLVGLVKKVPGRSYRKEEGGWVLPATAEAAMEVAKLVKERGFMAFAGAADIINTLTAKAEAVIEMSRAEDADIDIPAPEGLAYLPFQKAGIQYAVTREHALIGDEPGLGKTIESVGVSNYDEDARSVLVICPATAKINWRREWKKWCVKGLSVAIGDKHQLPTTDVVIINFEALKNHTAALRARPWDLLIVDEAHKLKEKKSQRTQQVLGLWKKGVGAVITPIEAKRKLYLTGTPILNRPAELWNLINSLAPKVFNNWRDFVTRYCGAYFDGWGMKMGEPTNLDELQEKLRASIMVRRLKKDVLKELPPKVRQIIEIEDAKSLRAEKKALQKLEDELLDLRVQAELAKAAEDDAAYEQAVANLRGAEKRALREITKLRHQTALAKVPFVVDHVMDAIESGKVILFAEHLDVIEQYRQAFDETCVVVTGETKEEDRDAAVQKFQNDPDCKVFIGNIKTAGESITLTAASHVIFAELHWTPGVMTQAEDRAHRIGQTLSLLVQHVVLNGSIDAMMAVQLVAKQKTIDRALNARDEKDPEFFEDAAPVLTEVQTPELRVATAKQIAEAEAGSASDLANNGEPPSTADLRRAQLKKDAATITDVQLAAIHGGLKELARVCDGASSEDSHGFNKFDARMGHMLAELATITKMQAALGRSMLVKYRRQLGDELMERMGLAPVEKKPAPKRTKKAAGPELVAA